MYSRTLYLHVLNKNDNVYATIDFSNLPEGTQGQKSQLNASAICNGDISAVKIDANIHYIGF